jgi:hypothetical protein
MKSELKTDNKLCISFFTTQIKDLDMIHIQPFDAKLLEKMYAWYLDKYDNFNDNSSLNVFDDGAVLLFFKFWTFSIISLFLNHYVSRIFAPLECMASMFSIPCPPIEASSINQTHQSRSPEDEGRAIPRNTVV